MDDDDDVIGLVTVPQRGHRKNSSPPEGSGGIVVEHQIIVH
jgi:hypothetical protein